MATRGTYYIKDLCVNLYNHWDNYPLGALFHICKWAGAKKWGEIINPFEIDPKSFVKNAIEEGAEELAPGEGIAGIEYKYVIDFKNKKILGYKVRYNWDTGTEMEEPIDVKQWAIDNCCKDLQYLTNLNQPYEPITGRPVVELIREYRRELRAIRKLPDEWFEHPIEWFL